MSISCYRGGWGFFNIHPPPTLDVPTILWWISFSEALDVDNSEFWSRKEEICHRTSKIKGVLQTSAVYTTAIVLDPSCSSSLSTSNTCQVTRYFSGSIAFASPFLLVLGTTSTIISKQLSFLPELPPHLPLPSEFQESCPRSQPPNLHPTSLVPTSSPTRRVPSSAIFSRKPSSPVMARARLSALFMRPGRKMAKLTAPALLGVRGG